MARVTPLKIGLTVAFLVAAAIGIGLIAPDFFVLRAVDPSRPAHRCVSNLKLIDAAKTQWALEKNKAGDAAPSWEDVQPYFGAPWTNGKPVCPVGGVYTIGSLNELPKCSIGGKEHAVN